MKAKITFLLALLPCMLWAQKGGNYFIDGTATGAKVPRMVYLMYPGGSGLKPDSTVIKDNKFSFSGHVDDVQMAVIYFDYGTGGMRFTPDQPQPDLLGLYLGDGSVKVFTADSISRGAVSGSQLNDEARELGKAVSEAMSNRDKEGIVTAVGAFLADYPASPMGVDAVTYLLMFDHEQALVQSAFDRLSPALRESKNGEKLAARIKALGDPKPQIGKPAFEFTQNDPNGKPVSLKDFRCKYLFIDFWASWCGPCRAENPHVVAAYEKYKGENFEILGVSLDYPGNHDKWMEAVEKDGLTWPQVSDLQGWDNAAATLYDVKSIPANFLLDPEGVIIATGLRGARLEEKLAEIFGR